MTEKKLQPEIVYEDRDILVCYKPAGLPVQTAGLGTKDLMSVLLTMLREREENGTLPSLYVVHRLDQPVQGLLVLARSKKAAAGLSAQAQDGRMEKEYLARVCAAPDMLTAGKEKELTDWLVHDRKKNVSCVAEKGCNGAKEARLSFTPVHDDLVRIRLYTGRHHQIRVQMAHAHMPLLGDRKYGTDTSLQFPALCAASLSFCHPRTGKRMTFSVKEEQILFR